MQTKFHQGDLQSGISKAIEQAKLVACFVHDEGADSSTWERDWLRDERVESLLADKAVLLRIEIESQEAGFLSAFCPIGSAPTLVVIDKGQLREYIGAETDRDTFIERLRGVLEENAPTETSSAPRPSRSEVNEVTTENRSLPAATDAHEPVTAPIAAGPGPAGTLQQPSPNNDVQQEVDEEEESASKRIPAKEKGKGTVRARPSPTPPADPARERAQAFTRARQQKKAEREELQRVLRLVDADKAERRAQEERRRALRESQRPQPIEQQAQPLPRASSTQQQNSNSCHLQIRLLDGSTIRRHFPPTATLLTDVRPWVASATEQPSSSSFRLPRNSTQPSYTFKHILTPLPSRPLASSDENEPLAALGLVPSATLVLIPARSSTDTPSSLSGSGISTSARSLFDAAYRILISFLAFLTRWFMSLTASLRSLPGSRMDRRDGSKSEERAENERRTNGASADSTGVKLRTGGQGIRIQTLRDRRREREGEGQDQLYNGNQLNFEPRKDHDDDKQ